MRPSSWSGRAERARRPRSDCMVTVQRLAPTVAREIVRAMRRKPLAHRRSTAVSRTGCNRPARAEAGEVPPPPTISAGCCRDSAPVRAPEPGPNSRRPANPPPAPTGWKRGGPGLAASPAGPNFLTSLAKQGCALTKAGTEAYIRPHSAAAYPFINPQGFYDKARSGRSDQ